jgi:hypothetical protein
MQRSSPQASSFSPLPSARAASRSRARRLGQGRRPRPPGVRAGSLLDGDDQARAGAGERQAAELAAKDDTVRSTLQGYNYSAYATGGGPRPRLPPSPPPPLRSRPRLTRRRERAPEQSLAGRTAAKERAAAHAREPRQRGDAERCSAVQAPAAAPRAWCARRGAGSPARPRAPRDVPRGSPATRADARAASASPAIASTKPARPP